MFCGRCGSALPEGSAFCPACGAQVEASAESAPVVQETPIVPPTSAEIPVSNEIPIPAEVPADFSEAPSDFSEAPANFSEDYAAPPVKPKKSHKRLVFSLIAAVLVVALLAGGLVYAFVWNKPDNKLEAALENTGDEFRKLLDNCDNLNAVLENIDDINSSGKESVELEMSGVSEAQPLSLKIRADGDMNKKCLSGTVDISVPGTIPTIGAQYYMDREQLVLAIPELSKNAYSVPTKDFGKKLLESPLAELLDIEYNETLAELSLDIFPQSDLQSYDDLYDRFMDCTVVEETDEKIPKADDSLTVYRVTLDWKQVAELFADLMENSAQLPSQELPMDTDDMTEQIVTFGEETSPYILVGVNDDNCVTAIHLTSEKEPYEFTILFEGSKNIWNDITLLVNGKTVATACFESTKSGFRFEIEADGEILVLECDDYAGELTCYVPQEDLFTVSYSEVDGGAEFSFTAPIEGEEIDFVLRMLPLRKIDTISDDPIDLFSLSENGLQMVALEIYGNLQKFQ